MLDFFVNRFYKDGNFSFLAKSPTNRQEIFIYLSCAGKLHIHKHIFLSTEPEIIYVPIPQSIFPKHKYTYNVYIKNTLIYSGQFYVISKYSDDYVKFGFVSCNDNSVIQSDNEKYIKCHSRGASNKVWLEIQNKSYDIIIHNGDNIYNDSTFHEYKAAQNEQKEMVKFSELGKIYMDGENALENARLRRVAERTASLFCQTYSDEYQGQCMRQCWNFHNIDDHDVTDCFGTPGTRQVVDNEEFHNYYRACKSVLDKYLIIDRDNTQNYYMHNTSFILYNYSFNVNQNYNLIFLDTRQSLYFTGTAYSHDMIEYCRKKIDSRKINIIVTPRPLFHMSVVPASLVGLVVKDAKDSTWHYKQYSHSKKFCEMLFEFSGSTPIFVVSGDIHETYIQTHSNGKNCLFYELVTSAVTRTPQSGQHIMVRCGLKTIYIFDRIINFFSRKHKIKDVRHRSFDNNFGELVYNHFYNYTFTEKDHDENIII